MMLADYSAYEDPSWYKNLEKVACFEGWLLKHSSTVQRLTISGAEFYELYPDTTENVKLKLPFAQLRQLRSLSCASCTLSEQRADPASSSSSSRSDSNSSGPFSLLTSLTALELNDVWLGGNAGFKGISTLTGLREVTLRQVTDNDHAAVEFSPLLHLPQLTALRIDDRPDGEARAAAVVAQLTGLRRLQLDTENLKSSQAAELAALTNLTELRCSYWADHADPASSARSSRSVRKRVHLISTVSHASLCC
jgi:hypothetical protein